MRYLTITACSGTTPRDMDGTGAYTAARASALSGVPKSTIHWWSRHDILVPSVSSKRVKLWSYADLMGLRVIYWLRSRKTDSVGVDIPRSSMEAVRRALGALQAADVPLWDPSRSRVFVDGDGLIYFESNGGLQNLDGQLACGELLSLIEPFASAEGLKGPDLARPKPELRIVPGKLSGSPHVVSTRIETTAIAALARDGRDVDGIISLYPFLTSAQVRQAIELEQELDANVALDAAA
jgi:uncharacterized protein (DUF433 family)